MGELIYKNATIRLPLWHLSTKFQKDKNIRQPFYDKMCYLHRQYFGSQNSCEQNCKEFMGFAWPLNKYWSRFPSLISGLHDAYVSQIKLTIKLKQTVHNSANRNMFTIAQIDLTICIKVMGKWGWFTLIKFCATPSWFHRRISWCAERLSFVLRSVAMFRSWIAMKTILGQRYTHIPQ